MCPHKVNDFGTVGNHFKSYKKGETIYFTGDSANTLYLIASGKVRILNYTESGEEIVKAILSRGEMFGELALLGEEERNEIAQSMEEGTTLCPVHTDDIHNLMKDNKEFSFSIYKWLGLRLRKMERRIVNLVFKDVRERLVDFIKELAQEKGEKKGEKIVIEHFYTHKNIANLIGTSRQTVTTTLNELRDEGLISFDRKSITILQPVDFG